MYNKLSVIYYDKVTSVLDVMWQLLTKNTDENTVGNIDKSFGEITTKITPKITPWTSVLALEQEKGKGRMGRVWASPKGHLYVAVYLPPANCFNNNCASVIFGFLVIKALNAIYKENLYLKWPNDILNKHGGKVGGILTEIKKDKIVVGLGINLNKAPQNFIREENTPQASALNIQINPKTLWTKLLKNILQEFEKIENLKLAEILEKAEELLLWKNKNIIVEQASTKPPYEHKMLKGTIKGFCKETGTLIVLNGENEYQVWSGSIYLA